MTRLDNTPVDIEELTQLCVVMLQIYYDGACPVECLEAKARTFALWHLARTGCNDRQSEAPCKKPLEQQRGLPTGLMNR
jgi:hypothetical protein